MRVEIKCVNKSNRSNAWERILRVGGTNANGTRWSLTLDEAIAGVRSGQYAFYVNRGNHTVNVIVAVSRFGNLYLKTEADGDTPDNLLSLPECP